VSRILYYPLAKLTDMYTIVCIYIHVYKLCYMYETKTLFCVLQIRSSFYEISNTTNIKGIDISYPSIFIYCFIQIKYIVNSVFYTMIKVVTFCLCRTLYVKQKQVGS